MKSGRSPSREAPLGRGILLLGTSKCRPDDGQPQPAVQHGNRGDGFAVEWTYLNLTVNSHPFRTHLGHFEVIDGGRSTPMHTARRWRMLARTPRAFSIRRTTPTRPRTAGHSGRSSRSRGAIGRIGTKKRPSKVGVSWQSRARRWPHAQADLPGGRSGVARLSRNLVPGADASREQIGARGGGVRA